MGNICSSISDPFPAFLLALAQLHSEKRILLGYHRRSRPAHRPYYPMYLDFAVILPVLVAIKLTALE